MRKIINFIMSIPADKWAHFALSLVIALVTAVIVKVCGGDAASVLAFAWGAGFVAGFAKEILDEIKSKSSDSYDWLADVIGTTLGTLVAYLLVL
jgi:VanZ family protein